MSSVGTEEIQRFTPASPRGLRTSESTLVSSRYLTTLQFDVPRELFRTFQIQHAQVRRAHQELLEVHLLLSILAHPPELLNRDHHDDLLAVLRNHLRSLFQRAPHQLAELLLGFLQLPGHDFSFEQISSQSRLYVELWRDQRPVGPRSPRKRTVQGNTRPSERASIRVMCHRPRLDVKSSSPRNAQFVGWHRVCATGSSMRRCISLSRLTLYIREGS